MRHLRCGSVAAAAACALAVAACGSASGTGANTSTGTPPASAPNSTPARSNGAASTSAAPPSGLAAAEHPAPSQFPSAAGHTLQDLAAPVRASAQFGVAGATFTPGRHRLDFALSANSGALVYAPTAVYVASAPNAHDVEGPFLAPADPLTVAPPYRSRQYEGPGDIAAIYTAQVRFPRAGTFFLLALARTPQGLLGAPSTIKVASSSPIPDVGQRPPAIATDTLTSEHGNIALVTTRIPPENMHSASFAKVLGNEPVALLFSTPQLCTSRVCGPVTDVMVSLQHEFAGRIAFIHEEVYAANNPSKGLRSQMKAFHLATEPWLFTIDRHGLIAARLEGAFGVEEARSALEAALR